jgi:hypothetical protein
VPEALPILRNGTVGKQKIPKKSDVNIRPPAMPFDLFPFTQAHPLKRKSGKRKLVAEKTKKEKKKKIQNLYSWSTFFIAGRLERR